MTNTLPTARKILLGIGNLIMIRKDTHAHSLITTVRSKFAKEAFANHMHFICVMLAPITPSQ